MHQPGLSQAAPPNTKATRGDWLEAARGLLIDKGVDHVRILTLSQVLKVSRSSFYWYFKDRADLLAHLVALWRESSTAEIVRQAGQPSNDIVEGVLHVFECWTAVSRFDPRLDFAMREWSRRDPTLHAIVLAEDATCVAAVAALFRRHGYEAMDAFVRARIMYFTQIGYYALELGETEEQRLRYTLEYVRGFTGRQPLPEQLSRYKEHLRRVLEADRSLPPMRPVG